MATRGDVQTDTFFVIGNPSTVVASPDFAETSVQDCCYELFLFGDTSDTDEFKNDRTGFFKAYDNSVTGASLVIQKCVGSSFVDVVTISDDTYGTFYDYGASQLANGKEWIGIYMDWRQLLIDPDTLGTLGEGYYRLKTVETNLLASVGDQNQYSFVYQLRRVRQ